MSGNVLTTRLGPPMMMIALLTTGCAPAAPSGTDAACDALRPHLPTYAIQDTEQSRREGAAFLDVFAAVCP